jgi:hypothetical protein
VTTSRAAYALFVVKIELDSPRNFVFNAHRYHVNLKTPKWFVTRNRSEVRMWKGSDSKVRISYALMLLLPLLLMSVVVLAEEGVRLRMPELGASRRISGTQNMAVRNLKDLALPLGISERNSSFVLQTHLTEHRTGSGGLRLGGGQGYAPCSGARLPSLPSTCQY